MSNENLRRRDVFFYWFEGNGGELPGEQIYFILSDDLGYTEENFIAQRKVYAEHDIGARYVAKLWCDQDSSVNIDWKVQFPRDPNEEKAELPKQKSFSLVYGPGTPVGLGVLLALSTTPATPTELVYQAVYAYILALIADGTIGGSGGGSGGSSSKSTRRAVGTTSGTIAASDNQNFVNCTNGSATTLTVPTGLSAALGANEVFAVGITAGAGAVTPSGASGVTITNVNSHTKIKANGSGALVATAANTYRLVGETE